MKAMKNLIILILVLTIFFSIIPTTQAVDQQGLNYTLLKNEYVKNHFTATITNRDAPLIINFNDTSTNTHTAWNWSYTNVTPGNNTEVWFSTASAPLLTLEKGNWLINLNASNENGYNITPPTHFVNVSYNAADRRNLTGIPYVYYPADHIYNVPIDKLPIHQNSTDFANSNFGANGKLFAQFYDPYDVVDSSLPKSTMLFSWSDGGSTSNQYPIVSPEPNILNSIYIEGCTGDCQVYMYERDTDLIYEIADLNTVYENGSYGACCGGIFNRSNYSIQCHDGQGTSSSGGVALFPGHVRYDEVASGYINHTLLLHNIYSRSTPNYMIWPASTGGPPGDRANTSTNYPETGIRFRLKDSYDISGYSPTNQVILKALKKYGMISVGNTDINPNHAWSIKGFRDSRWNSTDLLQLGNVNGTSFEAVDESMLMIDRDSGQVNMTALGIYQTQLPSTASTKIGVTNGQQWYLDSNGNNIWEISDKSLSWGLPGDIPVIGDWNGDKKDDIGIFRPGSGIWSLDSNGNFIWEVSDTSLSWGLPGDIPVIGDWNGDGKDEIGIFRPSSGIWSLDSNGNYIWEVTDKSLSWGLPGDIPVVGDWTGDGKDEIGIFRPGKGIWSLDSNGNYKWEVSDKSVSWGLPGDSQVIGDWNGDGKDDIGIFRPGKGMWSLDSNGNFAWEVSDKSLSWGLANDKPVIGDWNGDGKDEIGIFRPSKGIWSLDSNGNYKWEVTDKSVTWGQPYDVPVVGNWNGG